MCYITYFHRPENGMYIYTNARCKVFTTSDLIREWLKFVQIRWVLRKDVLKRLISSFWEMNDCNSFSIYRIGQSMCYITYFHSLEYGMCICTNARCKVFTISDLIREWLKFVQIRWVLRKDVLKRLLSSFWEMNDCNSFNIYRIGQPMCYIASFHRSEYGMCTYTNARCTVFKICDLIREWLKFDHIRWV